MVGALRWPTRPLIPIEAGLPSVKARAGSWQVLQATVPSADRRPSKNSFWPRAIFSGVCGLSGGIAARTAPSGKPICRGDLGWASAPAFGIGGAFSVVCRIAPYRSALSVELVQPAVRQASISAAQHCVCFATRIASLLRGWKDQSDIAKSSKEPRTFHASRGKRTLRGAPLSAGRPRRRIPNDQFMIEQMPRDAIGPTVAPRLEANDQVGGDPGHRRHRLANGRQLGPNHAGDRRVVKTGHRQLARQIEPEFARHRYHRRGHVVIAGEDGGGRHGRTQHPLGANQAVAENEVAGLNQIGVDGNLVSPHLVDETEIALLGGTMLGSSQNKTDAAM